MTIPAELRQEILTACRVLDHFRMVEGFGHVSARVPDSDRVVITPRKALRLVQTDDLVEVDPSGKQVGGGGAPPLEVAMHLAIYRRRPDALALCRAHPRHVGAFAVAAEPIAIAHGFGTNLGTRVPVFREPHLITDVAIGDRLAAALGDHVGVMIQANGMIATGQSVPDACVKALFMEETAQLQVLARAAGLQPKPYSDEEAARRRGSDSPNEPVRAWGYYVAATPGA